MEHNERVALSNFVLWLVGLNASQASQDEKIRILALIDLYCTTKDVQ